MQSKAQMIAWTEAMLDRIAYSEGTAPEMNISEPPHGKPTLPPPPRMAVRAAQALAVDPHADTQPGEAGWSHSVRDEVPAHLDLGNRWLPW